MGSDNNQEPTPEITLANLPNAQNQNQNPTAPKSMPIEITSAASSPAVSPCPVPAPRSRPQTTQVTQRAHSSSSSEFDAGGNADADAASNKSTSVSSPMTDDFICFNEHEPWSMADLRTLYHLFRYGIPLQSVSRHLGRSFASCSLALKKIVTQQIVRHSIEAVAKHYDMKVDEVRGWVRCTKYDVPMETENSAIADTATSVYRNTWAVPAFIMGYLAMLVCVNLYGRTVVLDDAL